jgi:hypothetical protein
MGFWWGNLRKRNHFEDLGLDGRIILKWIFKKWNGGYLSIFCNSVDKIQVSLKSDENNVYFA